MGVPLGVHSCRGLGKRSLVHRGHLHALVLEVFQQLVVGLLRHLALQRCGFGGGLGHCLAVGVRQAVPGALAHQERRHLEHVARQGQVLLHFVQLARMDVDQRVLLPIDHALLQRHVQLGKFDLLCLGTQRLHDVHQHCVRRGAHLQALHVFDLGDGTFAVGHVADAVVPIAQHHHAFVCRFLRQLLAQRAVQQLEGLRGGGEHERHAISGILGHSHRHGTLRVRCHVQRAGAHSCDHGRIVAQLGRWRHLHLDAACGLGLEGFSKLDGGLVARIARGSAMAQSELHGLCLSEPGQCHCQSGGCQQGAGEGFALHRLSPGLCFLRGREGGQWISMPPFTSSVMPVQ